MSSTASFIDRETSKLRTHQILALSTHFITHKFIITSISSTNRADIGKQFRANGERLKKMSHNYENSCKPPVGPAVNKSVTRHSKMDLLLLFLLVVRRE